MVLRSSLSFLTLPSVRKMFCHPNICWRASLTLQVVFYIIPWCSHWAPIDSMCPDLAPGACGFVSSLHLSSQRQIRPIFSSFRIHMALHLRPLIISEPFSEVLPVWLHSPQNKLYLSSVNQFTSLSCWPARSPVPTSQVSSQTLLLLRKPVVIHSPPDPSSWHTSFSLELSAAAIVWPLAVTC